MFSRALRNASVFDPWWSVAPMITVPVWATWLGGPRAALITGVILMWGVRLTVNWYRRWGGLADEDWRHVELRERTGRHYWFVSFLGAHTFPALLVGLGVAPIPDALASAAPLCGWDLVALAVAVGGTALELVADEQLRAFRRAGNQGPIDVGLWRWSRHPNYLGEILFWSSIPLFCVGAGTFRPWHVLGALGIVLLFSFVSIPMMEARQLARRPGYAAYRERTPRLLPLPRW